MQFERKEVIGNCTLFLADCLAVMPHLQGVDAVVTDPPYGIKMAGGMGGGGRDGFGKGAARKPKQYSGSWDDTRPSPGCFDLILAAADTHIVWGGNYFTDLLPQKSKWLFWDKLQTMPSYSDGELAWTTLGGVALKKFVYNGSGLHAREKERFHPTQKPVALMWWCLEQLPKTTKTVLDPFMGSGTTLVACAKAGLSGIGIERDPAYFDIACRRVHAAYDQKDLFAVNDDAPVMKQASFLDGGAA